MFVQFHGVVNQRAAFVAIDDAHGADPEHAQQSSIAIAVASPPPMHRLAMPRLPRVLRKAPISVTRMRAPEAPMGWPRAQAPPWMLTFSCGRPCSFIAAMATTAKASLISYRSTVPALQPVLS